MSFRVHSSGAMRAGTCASRGEDRARAATQESEQLALRKLVRQLRAVHEELSGYRALLVRFKGAGPGEYEGLVATNRPELSTPFFAYLDVAIKAAHVRECYTRSSGV